MIVLAHIIVILLVLFVLNLSINSYLENPEKFWDGVGVVVFGIVGFACFWAIITVVEYYAR